MSRHSEAAPPLVPIRRIDASDLSELVDSTIQTVAECEQRYGLGSDMMAKLVDREAIIPTIDITEWCHGLRRAEIPPPSDPDDWNSWKNYRYAHRVIVG